MRQKDLSGELVASKEEKKEIEEYAEKLHFALTKPIIVFPSRWEEDIPERLKKEVLLYRMAQLIKREEGKATDVECVIYLYPATMEFPLSEEWFKIYSFLFVQVMGKENANFLKEEHYMLDDYEARELDKLKEWIWKKQWEHCKRMKKEKNEEEKEKTIREKYKQLSFGDRDFDAISTELEQEV